LHRVTLGHVCIFVCSEDYGDATIKAKANAIAKFSNIDFE